MELSNIRSLCQCAATLDAQRAHGKAGYTNNGQATTGLECIPGKVPKQSIRESKQRLFVKVTNVLYTQALGTR